MTLTINEQLGQVATSSPSRSCEVKGEEKHLIDVHVKSEMDNRSNHYPNLR